MHRAFTAFLDHLRVVQRSPLTIRRYADVLRDVSKFTGNAAPDAFTTEMLQHFVAAPCRDATPRTPAGVNLRIAVAKAVFSYLHRTGMRRRNPAASLASVKEPRRTPKYLTTAEATRLVNHVACRASPNRFRDLAIVLTLWQTGLRVSELARLGWHQLDLDRRELVGVILKGGHVLDVAINDETLVVLRGLRRSSPSHDDRAIFARYDGKGLSVRAIENLFATWRSELGWTRALHPHVLRHTHATGALALGVDIATVADLLRHNGLRSVTIYAAVQDQARRAALAKLGALVPPGLLERIAANDATKEAAEERPCVEEPFYEPGRAA